MKTLLKHKNAQTVEVLKQHNNIKITRGDPGDFYIFLKKIMVISKKSMMN